MARKRPAWRVTADDGLDQIITVGPPPFDLKDLPARLLKWTQQHDVIAFWLHTAARIPANSKPAGFSLEWYAQSIVPRLERLERFKQEHPEHAHVVFDAILAGYVMAEAFWRLKRGAQTRTGKKQRSKAPRAGRLSAAERARLAKTRQDKVEKEARELRNAHPDTEKLRPYQLATRLAERHGWKLSTVRSDLKLRGIT